MANIQALNPHQHSNIRINSDFADALGHNKGAVMVMPSELREVQREYPILFRKHPETGRLFINALLGFTEHENLYLTKNNQWQADYVPMAFRKGPFLIGFKSEDKKKTPIISIDMDDPRVDEKGKECLFVDGKEQSDYLQTVNDILYQMHENNATLIAMINTFNELNLIEPLTLNINLHNGEEVNFSGAYTIAEEKLLALTSSELEKLNSQGFLSAAYYISGSLNNVNKLIKFKQAQAS
ncbi:SapC family protein [Aliiglaciecola lipolytica]|uniref:SapC family protein n=1 Tax=Aliiglaciecola lipolytica E3 TaxID=1127673 RepID=K6YFC4_9ALTE|nr:SapC family protein [Aliiglaciecola lipolytica]GAC15308.1 hypothetical protein GLIP_2686 [Aliiglaciecola lipolytica E3]